MEDTIKKGDIILISKTHYKSKFFEPIKQRVSNKQRVNESGKIKSGDIVSFRSPFNNIIMIKRIVGIPGDSIEIKDGILWVNGNPENRRPSVKHFYKLKFSNEEDLISAVKAFSFLPQKKVTNNNNLTLNGNFNNEEIEAIKKIYDLEIKLLTNDRPLTSRVHRPENTSWTTQNYGPIVVPKKGSSVLIKDKFFELNSQLINKFEGVRISRRNNIFYLNDIESKSYTFKINYFFVLGDNRNQSNDSRYWWLIPEEHIEGKFIGKILNWDVLSNKIGIQP